MSSHPYVRKHVKGRHPVAEHILVAEKALGRPLPEGAQVHHFNGIKRDNRNENLVICQDGSYHLLLHRRQKSFDACGHADWFKCTFCKKYDDPSNLTVTIRSVRGSKTPLAYHKVCNTKAHRLYESRLA